MVFIRNPIKLNFRWLIAFLISASCQANGPEWQSPEYITNSFYEVALGNEHGKSDYRIRKWLKPLRIYVEHQVGDIKLHNQLLNAHIRHLRAITGFDIQRVSRKTAANIQYYFTNQKRISELVNTTSGSDSVQYLHGAVCIANFKTNPRGAIQSANIYIPVDQARMHGKLVACIVEELTQVLGLVRDSDLVFPSIFNDKSLNALLTGLDEILLRLLSNPNILPGMTKKQLSPVINKIIGQYQASGIIISASKRVQQGELYSLLGYR